MWGCGKVLGEVWKSVLRCRGEVRESVGRV